MLEARVVKHGIIAIAAMPRVGRVIIHTPWFVSSQKQWYSHVYVYVYF